MVSLLFTGIVLVLVRETFSRTFDCNANDTCGCSKRPATVSRIVGGETAAMNSWGWAVSLYINNSMLCGGSLISDSWILTAAHCVRLMSPSQVLVSAATDELLRFNQGRRASKVIVHPDYNHEIGINDIALIQVAPAFNMSDPGIATLCLPAHTTGDYPPVNSSLVVIGWGLLAENGDVSDMLQQVTVQRVPYQSRRCYPLVKDNPSQICAGVEDGSKDSCHGDSGGPLMIFNENQQWVVTGIVSYGYACANPYYSTVYTRVSYYMNWIQSMNVSGDLTDDGFPSTRPTCTLPTSMGNRSDVRQLAFGIDMFLTLMIFFIFSQ